MSLERERTREPQYHPILELRDRKGRAQMGLLTSATWHSDPKRLAFVLARYKFVAKMLDGMDRVLEVGCGDGFGARIVRQHVGSVKGVDFDPIFIADAKLYGHDEDWPIEFAEHDILEGPVAGAFEAAYALDVVEHIVADHEEALVDNIAASLVPDGVIILGSPSLESQMHASPMSREGHVNCKSLEELRDLVARRFRNVFMFSMNDEVVHTGFGPMAHYLLAMGVGRRD